jgi:hypothetical protein
LGVWAFSFSVLAKSNRNMKMVFSILFMTRVI